MKRKLVSVLLSVSLVAAMVMGCSNGDGDKKSSSTKTESTSNKKGGHKFATFVGHDHVNDYVVDWKGILLCYGRFTGGNTVYHDIPGGNGARVIELTQGVRSFKTWERLEGGKIINEVNYPSDFQRE